MLLLGTVKTSKNTVNTEGNGSFSKSDFEAKKVIHFQFLRCGNTLKKKTVKKTVKKIKNESRQKN